MVGTCNQNGPELLKKMFESKPGGRSRKTKTDGWMIWKMIKSDKG
jgi:hypothetical protein